MVAASATKLARTAAFALSLIVFSDLCVDMPSSTSLPPMKPFSSGAVSKFQWQGLDETFFSKSVKSPLLSLLYVGSHLPQQFPIDSI